MKRVLSKIDAAKFFKNFAQDMQIDKYHKAELDHGVGFIGRYAYISNDIMCGRARVNDGIPCSPLYWSYGEEESVKMPNVFRERLRTFVFDEINTKVLFLRTKDIREAIPKLTPLKKCVSDLVIRSDSQCIKLSAEKAGTTLSQIYCPKNFYKGKELSPSEGFQGIARVNLFYVEKIALENSLNCDIIGVRFKNNSAQFFTRREGEKVDYIIKNVRKEDI